MSMVIQVHGANQCGSELILKGPGLTEGDTFSIAGVDGFVEGSKGKPDLMRFLCTSFDDKTLTATIHPPIIGNGWYRNVVDLPANGSLIIKINNFGERG